VKIHHIGYLVKNIEKAKAEFSSLGYRAQRPACYDASRDVDICFLRNGEYVVELVSPRSEASVAWRLSKRLGDAPYHICYESDDFDADVERFKNRNYTIVSDVAEAIALDRRKVIFLSGRNLGLIEIAEGPRNERE
jgi:methylmalonyl-CoA/ethylmalonyl-CoA epimerase